MNIWNRDGSLEAALSALRRLLGVGDAPDGHSEYELRMAERRIGRALPEDLRALYRALPPEATTRQTPDAEDFIFFCALKDLRRWAGGLVRREELPQNWRSAEFITFGRTTFGDDVLYCTSPPRGQGTIAVTNHEDDATLEVLGDCLADWLSRLAAFSGRELAVAPGEANDIAHEDALAYARDHARLNPGCEWAAKKIYEAENPNETRIIYWDSRENRLRPIEELPWLTDVTLSGHGPLSLEPLRNLQSLEHLLIAGYELADLSPLGVLSELRWLGIYNAGTLSVKPLNGLRKLGQLRTLSTLILDVGALASIETLEFVEITNCPFRDVAAIGALSSLTEVSVSGTQVEDLGPLLKLPRIEYLQIDNTPIRDITACARCRSLKTLVVREGQFDAQMLEHLQLACPGLEISQC